MKPKTLLYILIALAIVAIGVFLVYQVISRGSGTNSTTGQTGSLPSTTNQQFPVGSQVSTTTAGTFGAGGVNSSSSRFGIVSNDPTLDYFVSSANVVTVIQPNGTIESITNNATNTISGLVFQNIITASFSYDGKKILISSRTATSTQTSVFDLVAKSWIALPVGMISPVWSPINYQVAYLTNTSGGSEILETVNAVTANAKPATLTTLGMEDSLLQWPSKNTFIISDRPSAFITGSAWSFSTTNNTLSLISFENLGFESMWDASGAGLTFSAQHGNQGGILNLIAQSGNQKLLSFTTLPAKCLFHNDIASTTLQAASSTKTMVLDLYCAIPQDQNTLGVARLPDEYDQKMLLTTDDIYKINTTDGSSVDLLSGQSIDATNLRVFNGILFFVSRYDQKLYALTLQ
jgi:hypothetical protein